MQAAFPVKEQAAALFVDMPCLHGIARAALSGMGMDPQAHAKAIAAVTAEDVARVAKAISYHSEFLLKGVSR